MRQTILFLLIILGLSNCYSQKPNVEGRCLDPKFEKKIINSLNFSIETLTVSQLKESKDGYLLMDAREKEEFETSHIPGAIHVGYDHFEIEKYQDLDKDKPILVYCSIGYRSEKIGEKLKKAGFKHVYNLFGSIFEWANQSNGLEDNKGMETQNIHTYNRSWGQWINNPKIKKVY